MANTRKVLLSLHNDVIDHLDQERNKSAVVDALVAAHYGLSFEGTTSASSARQTILDSLKQAAVVVPIPAEIIPIVTPELPAINELVAPSEPVMIETVAPQVESTTQPEVTPVVSSDFVPVAEMVPAEPDFVPVVQPLDPVEPTSEVPPAEPQVAEPPVIVEPEISEVEKKIRFDILQEPIEVPEPPVEPPVPVAIPAGYYPGTRVCPNCAEEMTTPICLNCL